MNNQTVRFGSQRTQRMMLKRGLIALAAGVLSLVVLVTIVPRAAQGTSAASDMSALLDGTCTYGVTVAPTISLRLGEPGASVTHTLRVTNTGTLTDSFDLSVSGSRWPTDVLVYQEGSGFFGTLVLPQLPPAQGENVQVVVHIPDTANGNESDVAVFRAVSQGNSGYSSTATLTTTVNVRHGVQVYPHEASDSGDAGTSVTHTLRVTNTGNATDSFTMTVSSHWTATVQMDESGIVILPLLLRDQGKDVQVVVRVPSDASGNESDVATFVAVSQGNPVYSDTATLTTTAKPRPGVDLDPPVNLGSRDPGERVTHTFHVTNTGNLTDTFTISSAVPPGWPESELSVAQTASIGVGVNQSVIVTFTVGTNVVSGTPYLVFITATSQISPDKADTMSITITARGHKVYLPMVVSNYPPPWKQGNTSAGLRLFSMAACQRSNGDAVIYAGARSGEYGVYVSTDGGQSWTRTNVPSSSEILAVTVDPTNCDRAYAAMWGNGVYWTEGGTTGGSWATIGGVSPYVYALAVKPDGSELYAGTNSDGIWKATVKPTPGSWQDISGSIRANNMDMRIRSLAADGDWLWAGSTRQVYRSKFSSNWDTYNVITAESRIWAVAMGGSWLYVGVGLPGDATQIGVYRTDFISGWSRLPDSPQKTVYALRWDATRGRMYVGMYGEGGGVYQWDGTAWRAFDSELNETRVNALALVIHQGQRRLVAGTDDGAWWAPILP